MRLLQGDEIVAVVDSIVHAKTQLEKNSLDLTVASIHRINKRGSLDFGGSEMQPAETVPLTSHKKGDDEKYGWWELRQGLYILCYNERLELSENLIGYLCPHPRLTQTGCTHTASYIQPGDKLSAVLHVPVAGCALKENCRVSRLQLFEI